MNIPNLLKKRDTVYGILAIWIVLFHIRRDFPLPYIPVISNIVGLGNFAVDIFLFYSGLCLCLSAAKHNYPENGWGEYFKKRVLRIFIPYFLICIPFYIWSAVYELSGSLMHRLFIFCLNISSAKFWLKGTLTTWYVYAIVFCYIVFPLLYSFLRKSGRKGRICMLIGMAGFAIIANYIPVLNNSINLWARLPVFSIGIIFGFDDIKLREPNKLLVILSAAVTLGLGYVISLSELSEKPLIPNVYRFLLYIPMTLAVMVLLSAFGGRIGAFEFAGRLSLEIYLIHIALIHIVRYRNVFDVIGLWIIIALPAVSILISWIVSLLEAPIRKTLTNLTRGKENESLHNI